MMEEGSKPSDESSDSLWNFVIGVKSLLDKDISSVRDRIRQQIGTLEDLITSKAELISEEDTIEVIADEVTVDASKIADLSVEAVNSSSNTAEEEDEEIDADQVNDMQEKGFRAWLSRTFRRQQNNRNHHPATKVEKYDQD
jgi:cytoskeletal protein RodZ